MVYLCIINGISDLPHDIYFSGFFVDNTQFVVGNDNLDFLSIDSGFYNTEHTGVETVELTDAEIRADFKQSIVVAAI